jgi:hypothetical protein
MKKSLLLCLLLCCSSLFSQTRNSQQAQQLATQFFFGSDEGKQNAPANETLQLVYTRQNERVDAPVKNLFYIFNKTNGGGFVIISGDERAKTVLGYSDKNNFNTENIPDGLKYFFNCYAQEISSIPDDIQTLEVIKEPVKINSIVKKIEPLIKTSWGQGDPYNSLCPIDLVTGDRSLAGCGPVAIGQIMRSHGFPPIRMSEDKEILSRWDEMSNSLAVWEDDNQINLIAKLLSDIGGYANANYGSKITTTTTGNIMNVLKNKFCYSPNMKLLNWDNYSLDEWSNVLKHELDSGRPVLYYGSYGVSEEELQGSHLFICDGYDSENKFHFNFGNGRKDDVYCDLTAIQSGTKIYGFNIRMIIGIKPYCAGENMAMEKIFSYYDKVSRKDYFPNDAGIEVVNLKNMDNLCTQFDLTSYIENGNKERYKIIFGVDSYQGFIYIPQLTRNQHIGGMLIINDEIKNGNYKLYVGYYLPENKEPNMNYKWLIKNEDDYSLFKSLSCYNGSRNYINLTITDDTVYFDKNISDLKVIQADKSDEINFSYSESKISFYSEELVKIVSIYTLSGARIKIIPINKMGKITVSTNNLLQGYYLVRVETDEGRKTGKFIKF